MMPLVGGDADGNQGSGPSESAIRNESRLSKVAISLAVIVIGVLAILEIYRVQRHDLLGSQATNLGEIFIHSSPVVEEDLGSVQTVKETQEERRANPRAGWNVSFDVVGKRKSGVVEMRLTKVNGEWLVPSAVLEIDSRKLVNLR
jgi:hypothetical protein